MALLARLAGASLARVSLARSASTDSGQLAKAVTAAALASRAGGGAAVPRPRGQFDSPAVFLRTIGRGCEKFADKFSGWDQLFRADSAAMKGELGIGPKQRKWILMWTNKFRLGIDPCFIPTSKKHTMKRSERLARIKKRRAAGRR
ncbi:hypothetical protein IWQ57_001277 [Coemansia nantahalensis]|uniref:Uncharacterized protein n=2 Tax=Coemansia TaxID=4863 RepID=A0ACC1LDA4_9FUNG|nr:hypothetical protein IWQ57_001277 [Coemansia nantahalensis]KAJ2805731.1 hypothetical protein H4R21_001153 [Coemansia helicoidea]